MRSDGQKGEMRSIHGGQKATEGKRNRGSLTAIAPVPCRRAFRADINFYSLLLSGVAVTTLLYFAAEGPRAAGGGVEWKKQLRQWCAVSHCSSSPHCAQLVLDISSTSCTFRPSCSSKAESPKVVPKTRIWQAGMADVEHKVKQVWELRQDGSWDLDRSFPARLCLAGLWYECDSLHT